jgi:hypothetical protein
MTSPTKYRVTLTPLPGKVPPAARLRQGLKSLLRVWGLKCVGVEELKQDEPPAARSVAQTLGGDVPTYGGPSKRRRP